MVGFGLAVVAGFVTVAICAQALPFQRKTLNESVLAEPNCQLKVICVLDVAVAERFIGTAGGVLSVFALIGLDHAESPAVLVAHIL